MLETVTIYTTVPSPQQQHMQESRTIDTTVPSRQTTAHARDGDNRYNTRTLIVIQFQ